MRTPFLRPAMPISSIRMGASIRQDMGDVAALAESIREHGLLHAVVILEDGTLVAGRRRIAAHQLLGRTAIPAMVVNVADLLKAQRDENEVRKSLTPSEAVALGRLIEERERPRAEENRRLARINSAITKRGPVGPDDSARPTPPAELVDLRGVAARAVGMGHQKYTQAKAVVAAAEADPERFGDIRATMDETGNVGGAHTELERRRRSPGVRSAVHYRAPYPKPNEEMRRGLALLDGVRAAFELLEIEKLDPAMREEWAKALRGTSSFLADLARRVRLPGPTRRGNADDETTERSPA
jgi:hypothetical protein